MKVMYVAMAAALVAGCAPKTEHARSAPTGALLEFRQRVDEYVALQKAQLSGVGVQRNRNEGDKLDDTRRVMAERMRGARPNARQGDIFTPAVAAVLRPILDRELRGTASASTRASIRDDGPAPFEVRVNMDYPGGPLATMPGNVLSALPTLPEGLDFRLVHTHLILRDTVANIVVDHLSDVMCAKC